MMKTGTGKSNILRYFCLLCVIALGLMTIIATGGGGGGSGYSGGTGSVAVFLSDGPADQYDHVWIWITEVSLIPPERSNRDPVVIFRSQSPQGFKLDLLAYRDEDFLLTIKRRVPSGHYEKIRLKVANIESEGGDCDKEWIKLPSGKIDLNPQGTFEVRSGATLSIGLDIDADKSINLHPAGQSGKCIFRPVVFVDIEPLEMQSRCPRILKGTIEQLTDENGDDRIEGLVLTLPEGRGTIEVSLLDDTRIFNDDGLPATPDDLAVGQTVWVRGRLDADGHLLASVVVVGDILDVMGTVTAPVNSQGLLPLELDPGQELVGDIVQVKLAENETLVLHGCDKQVSFESIKEGMPARVVGKYSVDDENLRAIVVFLRPRVISGELVSVQTTDGGSNLTVLQNSRLEIIFLPKENPIYLQRDGVVPLELLCEGRQVTIVVDPEKSVLTAQEVRVQFDRLEGTVAAINKSERTLIINGQTVFVQLGVTILDLDGNDEHLVGFDDIISGAELRCFGLVACPNEVVDFHAFVILILDSQP